MALGPHTDTLPTRASLLGRLRNLDDARTWQESFERYQQRVRRVAVPPEIHAGVEAEPGRHIVHTLFRKIEGAVSPKQLQIFQLLVLDDAEPAKGAKIDGMSLTAVYVTKHRVAEELREKMARRQFL